jgi:hypothetical protein
LAWRRAKVIEMKAQGMTQLEIARELQVSDTAIGADIQYLRQQAKEAIKEYVTELLPQQYQICLSALDIIIKRSFDMLNTTNDNRERLQAMQLFRDTHLTRLELLGDAQSIDSAIEFIRSKQPQQQQQQQSEPELQSESVF